MPNMIGWTKEILNLAGLRSIGTKKKADQKETRLFGNYSNGVVTSRDAWCCNFSQDNLERNVRSMISFYNSEVERFNPKSPATARRSLTGLSTTIPKKLAGQEHSRPISAGGNCWNSTRGGSLPQYTAHLRGSGCTSVED